MAVRRVLFVCTGNTCRSPMAEALLRAALPDGRVEVLSAGIAGDPEGLAGATPESSQVMRERGIDLSGHRSRRLSGELLATADLVLTMTRAHKAQVMAQHPEAGQKVFTLHEFLGDGEGEDISDPFGGTLAGYRSTAQTLAALVARVAARLNQSDGSDGP